MFHNEKLPVLRYKQEYYDLVARVIRAWTVGQLTKNCTNYLNQQANY